MEPDHSNSTPQRQETESSNNKEPIPTTSSGEAKPTTPPNGENDPREQPEESPEKLYIVLEGFKTGNRITTINVSELPIEDSANVRPLQSLESLANTVGDNGEAIEAASTLVSLENQEAQPARLAKLKPKPDGETAAEETGAAVSEVVPEDTITAKQGTVELMPHFAIKPSMGYLNLQGQPLYPTNQILQVFPEPNPQVHLLSLTPATLGGEIKSPQLLVDGGQMPLLPDTVTVVSTMPNPLASQMAQQANMAPCAISTMQALQQLQPLQTYPSPPQHISDWSSGRVQMVPGGGLLYTPQAPIIVPNLLHPALAPQQIQVFSTGKKFRNRVPLQIASSESVVAPRSAFPSYSLPTSQTVAISPLPAPIAKPEKGKPKLLQLSPRASGNIPPMQHAPWLWTSALPTDGSTNAGPVVVSTVPVVVCSTGITSLAGGAVTPAVTAAVSAVVSAAGGAPVSEVSVGGTETGGATVVGATSAAATTAGATAAGATVGCTTASAATFGAPANGITASEAMAGGATVHGVTASGAMAGGAGTIGGATPPSAGATVCGATAGRAMTCVATAGRAMARGALAHRANARGASASRAMAGGAPATRATVCTADAANATAGAAGTPAPIVARNPRSSAARYQPCSAPSTQAAIMLQNKNLKRSRTSPPAIAQSANMQRAPLRGNAAPNGRQGQQVASGPGTNARCLALAMSDREAVPANREAASAGSSPARPNGTPSDNRNSEGATVTSTVPDQDPAQVESMAIIVEKLSRANISIMSASGVDVQVVMLAEAGTSPSRPESVSPPPAPAVISPPAPVVPFIPSYCSTPALISALAAKPVIPPSALPALFTRHLPPLNPATPPPTPAVPTEQPAQAAPRVSDSDDDDVLFLSVELPVRRSQPCPPTFNNLGGDARYRPILTHVIDGYVIQEASEPFAVSQSRLLRARLAQEERERQEFERTIYDRPERERRERERQERERLEHERHEHERRQRERHQRERRQREQAQIGDERDRSPPRRRLARAAATSLPADIREWTLQEVRTWIARLSGEPLAAAMLQQEVDGAALLLVRPEDLVSALGIKLGPALKIVANIDAIRPPEPDEE